jgi:hypothetical protein
MKIPPTQDDLRAKLIGAIAPLRHLCRHYRSLPLVGG